MNFNGLRITPKQVIIICILHQFRGLRYDQLLLELAQRMSRQDAPSFRKNTYKDLQQLEEMKLLIRDPVKLERTVDFIYLSEAGLECACELLNIPFGHFGAGWDKDWGDFAYEIFRPAKVTSAVIHHHMMLTDVQLILQWLQRTKPELNLDFRNNLYSSVEYETDGQLHRFRPDADLIFLGRSRYLVEADRGTEYGEKLREKFRSYAGYLNHLEKIGEPLPAGVIFIMNNVSPTGNSRRWSLVSSAFMDEMSDWSTRFNLIGGGIADLESILHGQFNKVSQYDNFSRKANSFRTDNVSFGILKEGHGLPWESPTFSIVTSESDGRIYVYERVEPFETIGISRIYAWWKWHHEAKKKYSDIAKVKHFIPILWRSTGDPFPLFYKGCSIEKDLEQIFINQLWLSIENNPKWYLKNGQELNVSHPLIQYPL